MRRGAGARPRARPRSDCLRTFGRRGTLANACPQSTTACGQDCFTPPGVRARLGPVSLVHRALVVGPAIVAWADATGNSGAIPGRPRRCNQARFDGHFFSHCRWTGRSSDQSEPNLGFAARRRVPSSLEVRRPTKALDEQFAPARDGRIARWIASTIAAPCMSCMRTEPIGMFTPLRLRKRTHARVY